MDNRGGLVVCAGGAMSGVTRRQLLMLAGAAGGALTLPLPAFAAGAFPWREPAKDQVADIYLDLLHANTRWVEQQWDETIGAYSKSDFRFVAVLGNAVLLRAEKYDEQRAGVPKARLKSRTLATIDRYAASNRLAGGDQWGQQLFWDSTFELYFVLAARLLWDDLSAGTQANIQRIAIGQGKYTYGLGVDDDPLSGDWTPNGTAGGWEGDTKLEEMGVYAQSLAPLLAWTESDAKTRERFAFWAQNASGLPVADRVNDTAVDGRRICDRALAHNIHDSFVVENHKSVNPHYQAELWRTAGRAAIHYLAAGKALPQMLTRQPNGEQLWRTLRLLASDAGEPVMPMIADRYHLYGRDVLPLAFLAQVQGDADAARAEADLAARLGPYLAYEPADQLTKFSGEDKYEPEARAELAIAYLFHRQRGVPVKPSSTFFEDASGTRDFGTDIGLVVQQGAQAFAAAVTKPDFVRCLWQPRHDNWLVDSRAPGLLPPGTQVKERWAQAYEKVRDGVDATVTVLTLGEQKYAGFATLPTGSVVYASTGLGAGEGALTIFNLTMPGVPGLTGTRTFKSAGGTLRLSEREASGDGGTDLLKFAPHRARYVRMLCRETATSLGLSVWTFAVLDKQGADLAQGAQTGASSSDISFPSRNATDGNPETRWAVDRTQLAVQNSWLAVDLGSPVMIAGVRLDWEDAYATKYAIQTSTDAVTWTDAVVVPKVHKITGGWVNVDDRFGLVSRGPITVTANGVSAPAKLIEGYVATGDLAAAAKRTLPTALGLTVSDADGFLSAFNLTAGGATATVTTPWTGRVYRGVQQIGISGLLWTVTVPGATGLVEPPRFTVTGSVPVGTRFDVADSHHVVVTAAAGKPLNVLLRAGAWSSRVRLRAGESKSLVLPGATVPAAQVSVSGSTVPAPAVPPAPAVTPAPQPSSWLPPSLFGSPASPPPSLGGLTGLNGLPGPSTGAAFSGSSGSASSGASAGLVGSASLGGSPSSASPVPSARPTGSDGSSEPTHPPQTPSAADGGSRSEAVTGGVDGSGGAAGSVVPVSYPGPAVTPTDDLARGRSTYPTSPLPAGTNSPSRAVDGNPDTAWRPGASGRMVVDLGKLATVAEVRQTWSRGKIRPVRLALSTDGLTFVPYSAVTPTPARYLQLTVLDWQPGDAELIELAVRPPAA